MKHYLTLTLLLLLQGCGSSSTPSEEKETQATPKGELIFELNAQKMKAGLMASGWTIDGYEVYGYQAYKIPYVTKDEQNNDINTSGLLVLPTGLDEESKEKGLSLVSYGHGTITSSDDAPTVFSEGYHSPIESAIIFSSLGGFATLQADYIGYGDSSESYHPYVMQNSLATASVDLIHAVKAFTQENNIKLNEKLFVTGYSEGGYTAMSTLKRLEEQNITVTAAAPMAGPYNLNLMADVMLGIEEVENLSDYSRVYTLLTANAYSQSYDQNISDFINTHLLQESYYDENGTRYGYSVSVNELLGGYYYMDNLLEVLPNDLVGENGLVKPSFVEEYETNPNHWFREALQLNSVDNWIPQTPTHLIHCQGDDQVPYKVAEQTYENFINNGTQNVTLVTPDVLTNQSWDHEECFYPSLEYVAEWFVRVRDQ